MALMPREQLLATTILERQGVDSWRTVGPPRKESERLVQLDGSLRVIHDGELELTQHILLRDAADAIHHEITKEDLRPARRGRRELTLNRA